MVRYGEDGATNEAIEQGRTNECHRDEAIHGAIDTRHHIQAVLHRDEAKNGTEQDWTTMLPHMKERYAEAQATGAANSKAPNLDVNFGKAPILDVNFSLQHLDVNFGKAPNLNFSPLHLDVNFGKAPYLVVNFSPLHLDVNFGKAPYLVVNFSPHHMGVNFNKALYLDVNFGPHYLNALDALDAPYLDDHYYYYWSVQYSDFLVCRA